VFFSIIILVMVLAVFIVFIFRTGHLYQNPSHLSLANLHKPYHDVEGTEIQNRGANSLTSIVTKRWNGHKSSEP
jgi:hypothetical protein